VESKWNIVGTTVTHFSSNTLNDGDIITVVMTSNAVVQQLLLQQAMKLP
jgi:hypothetical protein